jgi:hypothetical protein
VGPCTFSFMFSSCNCLLAFTFDVMFPVFIDETNALSYSTLQLLHNIYI